jgi:hypothetical protein
MPEQPKDPAPAAAAKPALRGHQAEAQPLVGGARSRRRTGVPHRVPEGRARGGVAAGGLRRTRMKHTAAAGGGTCGCRDACPAA